MEAETTEAVEEEQITRQDSMATLASISGVPKYNTFRMRGVLQGQRVSVLIDGGASHNFIDAALLKRRHIPTVEFEGFKVEVAGGSTMPCDRYIPGLKLTLGRHELIQDVYVMDLPDTNIILGVQWLSTLGPITTNYKTMEMSFTEEGGKKVVLWGMTGNATKVVTTKRMEAIFRRDEIVYGSHLQFACQLLDEQVQDEDFKVINDLIYYKDRIFLVSGLAFKAKLLQACHDSPMAGHQGINKTYRQVRERFSWKGLKEDVIRHVKECLTCHMSTCTQQDFCNPYPFQSTNGKAYPWISSPGYQRHKGRTAYL
jgi:hypothetical protein